RGESVFWTGHLAVFVGGFKAMPYRSGDPSPPPSPSQLTTGATYDPTTRRWRALPPLPSRSGRPALINGIWTGRSLVIWETIATPMGGSTRTEVWTPGSGRWRALPNVPLHVSPTNAAATVLVGHSVVIVEGGGEVPTFTTSLAIDDTRMQTWSTRTIVPKKPQEAYGSFASTGAVLVGVGIGQATQGPYGPVYAPSDAVGFDPVTGTVRPLPAPPYAVMAASS